MHLYITSVHNVESSLSHILNFISLLLLLISFLKNESIQLITLLMKYELK